MAIAHWVWEITHCWRPRQRVAYVFAFVACSATSADKKLCLRWQSRQLQCYRIFIYCFCDIFLCLVFCVLGGSATAVVVCVQALAPLNKLLLRPQQERFLVQTKIEFDCLKKISFVCSELRRFHPKNLWKSLLGCHWVVPVLDCNHQTEFRTNQRQFGKFKKLTYLTAKTVHIEVAGSFLGPMYRCVYTTTGKRKLSSSHQKRQSLTAVRVRRSMLPMDELVRAEGSNHDFAKEINLGPT